MRQIKSDYIALTTMGLLLGGVAACAQDEPVQTNSAERPMLVDEQIQWVREDIAARLGADENDVIFEAARVVQWRSGADGCPDPEKSYTMAIVPGVLFLLTVGNERHRYHSGADGKPFYCPEDRAEAPTLGKGDEIM